MAGTKILQHEDNLFNEEYKTRKHLNMGVHLNKGLKGIEANAQAGHVGNGYKKFSLFKRAIPTPAPPPEVEEVEDGESRK